MAHAIRRSALLATLATGLIVSAVASVSAQGTSEPDVFTQTLPNGMLLVVRERPSSRLAAITVGIRGGSRVEDDVTLGAAHFMEHMFFQGTPRRPNLGDLDRDLEELGGFSNAWTGQEAINFQIVVPDHAFDIGLDIMADMMVNSDFPADRFEKERLVVLEELNQNRNNPARYAGEIFSQEVVKGHPTEKLPMGSRLTINRITRDVILQYRDTFFVASNMVVAVTGNVRHEDVFGKAAAVFADMRQGPRPDVPVGDPPAATGRRIGVPYNAQQVQIEYGFPLPGSNSPDRYPLEVMNAILGGVGQRLFSDIVDRQGLALDISSGYWEHTDVGVWELSASVQPAKVTAVLDRVAVHLNRLAEELITEEELADALSSISGSLELRQESVEGQAQVLSDGLVLGVYMPLDEYLAGIRRVTAEEVRRVARQYLNPEKALIVQLPGAP